MYAKGSTKFTDEQNEQIRLRYATDGPRKIAADLGLTVDSVKHRAKRLGLCRKSPWTPDKIEILRQRYADEGPTKLAEELGLTPDGVLAKAIRLGLTEPLFDWTDERVELLKRRYVEIGGPKTAIELGCTLSSLWHKVAAFGLHTNAGHEDWGRRRKEANESCNIRYFDTWSHDMAYILGFIFADGNVNKAMTCLAINLQARDGYILDFIKEQLGSTHKRHFKDAFTDKRGSKIQAQAGLTISSKKLCESLMRLGVHPRKTYRDDPIPDVPGEFVSDLVRGYFDGDGGVHVTPMGYCQISAVGTPKFLTGWRNLLVNFAGISENVISSKGTHVSVRWQSMRDVSLFRAFVYDGDRFCMRRKRDLLDEVLSRPQRQIER